MEQTKNNRSLLRPRAAKKRGNPIFVSSQLISKREPVPISVLEPTSVKEVITPERNSSPVEGLTTLTNKRVNPPEEDFTGLGTCSQLKRQRTNDDANREEDNKCSEHETFVVSLPLIALDKRLDFGLSCDNDKHRPSTIAVTGEIYPKKFSLLSFAPSSGDSERHGRMSIFKAFDIAFNNKWGLGDDSRETSPEVESYSSTIRRREEDGTAGEEPIEKQLCVEESNDIIGNGDDEGRVREKKACKSVFDLMRLMELRRVGLVKPPKNPAKHIQFVREIRKCIANFRNKSFLNDNIVRALSVINQEVPTVEENSHTIEQNNEACYSYTTVEGADNNAASVTSPVRGDSEVDISYDRPILKRRRRLNSWQDLCERSKDEQEEVSFKDRLNPIAAAEYDEMEVIELDMYDELPNQFRSGIPKEFARHWSTKDTEEFYKCIALLGLDFGRIATVMGRTQKQITNKYKIEQKKNDQRLHSALIRQGEFFEYKKKYIC